MKTRLMVLLVALVVACAGGDPMPSTPSTPQGHGPLIRWDLGARPLPEIPLPNDVATWADPTSPTGIRINASMVAPTGFESRLRQQFDELDGWGTYQPITIQFDEDIDLDDLVARQRQDYGHFADDAVYLINLTTGAPVPLDLGEGNFVYTLREPDRYYANDPRGGHSNLVFEDVDEDVNHNGRMDPGEDTNFDGVLNRASVWPPASRGGNPYDNLSTFWEADTRTLILRPLVPLDERTRYAVVVTSRLRGTGGPVRSPFPTVAHPVQADVINTKLPAILAAHPEWYGDLQYTEGATTAVAFAYTYTTQTTISDMLDVRRGLYGEGPFAALGHVTPDMMAARLAGQNASNCTTEVTSHPYVIRGENLRHIFHDFGRDFGVGEADIAAILETYRWVSHIVVGTIRTPFLLGDPKSTNPDDHWQIDSRTGRIEHLGTDVVPYWMVVPVDSELHHQPFPINFYGHGYTSSPIEALAYAGVLAHHGLATMGIFATAHGHDFDPSNVPLLQSLLRGLCYTPAADALLRERARDLNGDGKVDSAGDFWTAYTFHTRDVVRQSILDHIQTVRAFRYFDGHALATPTAEDPQDYNGNGRADDIAGDFDGDGRVDAGGTQPGDFNGDGRVGPDERVPLPWYTWGESLGGILSGILGSAEPLIHGAVPVAGGGGLIDIGIRSRQGGVIEAVVLRLMGPLVLSTRAEDIGPGRWNGMNFTRTSCHAGQNSIRWVVPDVNSTGELEIACADRADSMDSGTSFGIQPGDDVRIENVRSGEVRCARAGANGTFRLSLPSSMHDRAFLTVFRGAAIDDYGTCTPRPNATVRASIDRYRVGEEDSATCSYQCGHIPIHAYIPNPTWDVYHRGDYLNAPAEGLGFRRQSPSLRRFMMLAQVALDPGDPISFAPLYFLRPIHVSDAPTVPHGVLNISTIGDQNVPLSSGNAFSRAAGLLPFFPPPPSDMVARRSYAPYAEFMTAPSLFSRYNESPNQVLIDHGVLEGVYWLNRAPSPAGPNLLFDPEDIAEGLQPFGQVRLGRPLRTVRASRLATLDNLDEIWNPRAGEVLSASLTPYIEPSGKHGFDPPERSRNPAVRRCDASHACATGQQCRMIPAGWGVCEPTVCTTVNRCNADELCQGTEMVADRTGPQPICAKIWDDGEYFTNLVGRYFESDARRIEYYNDPQHHLCLETSTCTWMAQTPQPPR